MSNSVRLKGVESDEVASAAKMHLNGGIIKQNLINGPGSIG